MAKGGINAMLPRNLGLIIGLAVVFPGVVNAAQWYSESSARARSVFDNNIRLTSKDHNAVVGMELTGTIKAGRRTEATDVNFNGEAGLKKYSGEDNLDTNDLDLGVDATHRTERDQFTFNAAVKLDSTLTSEIQSSGLMQSRKRRIQKNFALFWTRSLSERTSLKLGYSHIDTEYKNAKYTGLSNYTYQVIEAMLTHALNQKMRISLVLSPSLYKGSNVIKIKTRDLGFKVHINYDFTETFSAGGGVGVRYSNTEHKSTLVDYENNDSGFILNANIKRTFEQMIVDGLFSRNVRPSGSGDLLLTDILSAKVNYEVGPRLNLILASAVYRNSSTDEDDESRDRIYFTFQPQVRWKMTRRWLVEGSYRYRYQRYESSGLRADSNAIFLSVKYVWPSKPATGL